MMWTCGNMCAKRTAKLQAQLTALQDVINKKAVAENTRIVAESKQCHARNDELVSEHMELRKELEAAKELLNEIEFIKPNYLPGNLHCVVPQDQDIGTNNKQWAERRDELLEKDK